MKKFLRYFIPIVLICVATGATWRYFHTDHESEVVIDESEPEAEDDDMVETKAPPPTKTSPRAAKIIAVPTAQKEKTGVHIEMEATKLGVGLGRLSIDFVYDDDTFEIDLFARASGVLAIFLSDRMEFKSVGKFADGKMQTVYFSDSAVKPGKKPKTKIKTYTLGAGGWRHTLNDEEREIDMKMFDQAAADPLALLFYIARVLDRGGKCDIRENSFLDKTGFSLTSADKGKTGDSGIKSGKKKIVENRCDLVFRNRAGKTDKGFLFEHEFKKGAPQNAVTVYYSKMTGDKFVPVFLKLRGTPVGEIRIKLTKFKTIK